MILAIHKKFKNFLAAKNLLKTFSGDVTNLCHKNSVKNSKRHSVYAVPFCKKVDKLEP